jgi:hypothetical protein
VNVVVQMTLDLVHKSKKVARRPVHLAFGVEFLVYRHRILELKISLYNTPKEIIIKRTCNIMRMRFALDPVWFDYQFL